MEFHDFPPAVMMKVKRCFPLLSVTGSGPFSVLVVLFMYFVPSTHSCRLVMAPPCGGVALASTCMGLVTDVSWNGEHILNIASTGAGPDWADATMNPDIAIAVITIFGKNLMQPPFFSLKQLWPEWLPASAI